MEILQRLILGLFTALLFGGFPALFSALLTWKVVRSNREGVWVTRMGRPWTRREHPELFMVYTAMCTVIAVILGLVAAGVMIWMFLACWQAPLVPAPA